MPTPHHGVKIIGNGDDNLGEGLAIVRDRIAQTGGTINGVVLGGDRETIYYYTGAR
ncbi:hypothetical protein H8A99_39160 [Bradyrhizobium sp. Arg68]|uniref:hypothetical protein n=1 Tax=Bradyrhizobium ivorense TaxID=2511166 RepID=UPI001E2F811C|nr:hypothetical protein [Bradyrhizobium ivorense]MCC8942272.1 hypothetical protein [Bradyrhizobium ivorense]